MKRPARDIAHFHSAWLAYLGEATHRPLGKSGMVMTPRTLERWTDRLRIPVDSVVIVKDTQPIIGVTPDDRLRIYLPPGHDLSDRRFVQRYTMAKLYQWKNMTWLPVDHPKRTPLIEETCPECSGMGVSIVYVPSRTKTFAVTHHTTATQVSGFSVRKELLCESCVGKGTIVRGGTAVGYEVVHDPVWVSVRGTALDENGIPMRSSFNSYLRTLPYRQLAERLRQRFPALGHQAHCPKCNMKSDLFHMLVHMNDHHRMSREDIAAWTYSLQLPGLTVEGR
jgi:hypothetical protein